MLKNSLPSWTWFEAYLIKKVKNNYKKTCKIQNRTLSLFYQIIKKQLKPTTMKAHIQIGIGENAIITIINAIDTNDFIGELHELGYNLNYVFLLKITNN